MTRTMQRSIAGPHLTVAATPSQEVVVVMNYDEIRVAHVALTPDKARALAADIIAAAGRAENPREHRIIRTVPQDRDGMAWADKHDERL